ncbi:sodium-translocating pyrophosphatase [Alphaproteobacteria bacterium endosymbiont of Tiliacea citrago]|uniref:sodium-translocating pyrophosphatase n=1 Tax=Alphaproteobacteria bacterium endosymbiont of Tiliacea citrago TaxID=3077944 RepID=UPI00313ACA2D
MISNIFISGTFVAMILFALKEYTYLNNLKVIKHKEVEDLSNIIKSAGITYLFSQLKVLLVVEAIIMVLLYFCLSFEVSLAFFAGAILSWVAGFLSMYFSVTYNVKVALSAKNGYEEAFLAAFSVGKIIGVLVSGIAFLSCYLLYIYARISNFKSLSVLFIGFGFGASLISVFARIGGGIFTKGADIGADLVGKVEQGIPEDDPRNPAVIADALGDNVGDACGMSADLFQTFVVLVSGAIFLLVQREKIELLTTHLNLIFTILAAGSIASMIVLLTGWSFKETDKFASLGISIKTFIISSITLSVVLFAFFGHIEEIREIILSTICGFYAASLIMPLTEYYTSSGFEPVDGIVAASEQGSANNIIQGLSVGYGAVFFNLLAIISTIFIASYIHQTRGVAYACLGMISVCHVILALDAFGPVTDNAGGLVEMGGLENSVREVTDKLDAIGNMTKATTKGYAVFTAGLAAFVLNSLYSKSLADNFNITELTINNIHLLIGFFLGAAIVSYFASFCLLSVNRASMAIMEEVRMQFKTLKIMEGKDKPDYNKAIDLLTQASLKEMIIPSLLPIVSILSLFTSEYFFSNLENAFLSLGGYMMGVTLTGIVFSIAMTVSGGAWDNAKKSIEAKGQKGQMIHKSAVIGDTVGDPYKDTAGPAINPLIKLVGIFAMIIVFSIIKVSTVPSLTIIKNSIIHIVK